MARAMTRIKRRLAWFSGTALLACSVIMMSRAAKPVQATKVDTNPASAEVDQITLAQFKASYKTDDGTRVFIDARPADQFAKRHLAGSINMVPAADLPQYEAALSYLHAADFNQIIIYCISTQCEDAEDLRTKLVQEGFDHNRIVIFRPGWESLEKQQDLEFTHGTN